METFETLPFFRGVSSRYPTDRASIQVPRGDRRPRHSGKSFHEAADKWFEVRFGVRYRSYGVFLTSRILSATTYGATPNHVMRVIPLSSYRFCWSPKVSDLLFAANQLDKAGREEIDAYLDLAEYRESGLQEASATGHEVMLYCERYIAIPVSFLEAATFYGDSTSLVLSK